MQEQVGALPWWSCPSPAAHGCGLLNHPNSFRGGRFKLNTKFDAELLLYSLVHFECDSHTVHMLIWHIYRPHWLVQWSPHYSHMPIPVHSPWLPGHTDVAQTILVILTMVGLFWTGLGIKWCGLIPVNSKARFKFQSQAVPVLWNFRGDADVVVDSEAALRSSKSCECWD